MDIDSLLNPPAINFQDAPASGRMLALVGMTVMFIISGVKKLTTYGKGGAHKRFVALFPGIFTLQTASMLVLFAGLWELMSVASLYYSMFTSKLGLFQYSLMGLIIFTVLATLVYKLPLLPGETFAAKAIPLFANISLVGSFIFLLLTADPGDLF